MVFDIHTYYSKLESDFGSEAIFLDEVDSTNRYLKSLDPDYPDVVVADFQTAGRGRGNRTWISEPGESLMFSVKIPDHLTIHTPGLLPIVTGLSVIKVLQSYQIANLGLKWPNDIMVNQRKLGGILSEGQVSSNQMSFIIGCGINIQQRQFDSSIAATATSLRMEKDIEWSKEAILAGIMNHLNENFSMITTEGKKNKALIEQYKAVCLTLNQQVSFTLNGLQKTGKAIDINPTGELVIQTENGIIAYNGSEIEHVRTIH